MMYPYMVLEDKTGILHSELFERDGKQMVEVHFQRPTETGYDIAYCILPEYDWEECEGFTEDEIAQFETLLRDNVYWIYEYAEKGYQ